MHLLHGKCLKIVKEFAVEKIVFIGGPYREQSVSRSWQKNNLKKNAAFTNQFIFDHHKLWFTILPINLNEQSQGGSMPKNKNWGSMAASQCII